MQNDALAKGYEAHYLVESDSGTSERPQAACAPFVIGVTGHRNLAEADLARARGEVDAFFAELGKRSLMESYLWTIHRYHREHAPPAGA